MTNTDRIQKEITLRAPQSRVWSALTDHEQFSAWFQVALEGPIEAGGTIRGKITYEGCEHMTLVAFIEALEPESYFSFRWPHVTDPDQDPSSGPTTLVEFRLEPTDAGTHLTIVESGFDALPPEIRSECFVRNEGGWAIQVENIRQHVDG